MSDSKYTSIYMWALAVLAVIWTLMYHYLEPNIIVIIGYVVLAIIIFREDQKQLKLAGVGSVSYAWLLFLPGYLIRRSFLFKGKDATGGIVGGVVLAITLFYLVAPWFVEMSGSTQKAGNAYCVTVSEIISERNGTARCLNVVNLQKISNNYYRGTAQLTTGYDINFVVVYSDPDSYELTLKNLGEAK